MGMTGVTRGCGLVGRATGTWRSGFDGWKGGFRGRGSSRVHLEEEKSEDLFFLLPGELRHINLVPRAHTTPATK